MDFDDFKKSLDSDAMPDGLTPALSAMWIEARGDWDRAHQIAQDVEDASGAWVHAYLHRKEGDTSNAGYWYGQAGQSPFDGSHEQEWASIVQTLLGQSG